MKNFRKVWRRVRKKSKKGHWWWHIADEQWVSVYDICKGIRSPQSPLLLIGFIVKDGIIHARRLIDNGFQSSFGSHCGLARSCCLQCFSVKKPENLPMCERCRLQIEMFMDPAEAQRQTKIRKEINLEKRHAKQERRRLLKMNEKPCQCRQSKIS